MPSGSASGKVILLGEHAVVYGVPALVVGIEPGAVARADPRPGARLASCLALQTRGPTGASVHTLAQAHHDTDVGRAFSALLDACEAEGAVSVDARTDLPAAAGLGCSAALGVAIARALSPGLPPESIVDRATAWERVFHGNPSGVDTAAAARGGCLMFRRLADGRAHIEPVRLSQPLSLAIGHTGVCSATRAMVEHVQRQRAARPDLVDRVFWR